MDSSVSFVYGPKFQDSMLSLMLKDLGFTDRVIKYVDTDHLHSDAHKWLFDQIKTKYEKTGTIPSPLELEGALKKVEKHRVKLLKQFNDRIVGSPPESPEYIREQLCDFAKRMNFNDLFAYGQTLYNSGKLDDAYKYVLEQINHLHAISFKDDQIVSITDFEPMRQRFVNQRTLAVDRITTGIPALDKIFRGGLSRLEGELGVIVAPPKCGKCLTGSANVILADGSTKILSEIIKDKDRDILSFNEKTGRFEQDEIIDWIESGEKEVFDLITTSSVLRLTDNHPLLTLSGWRPLKDLKSKDLIFVPKSLPHGRESSISDERLTLLAYMLGDGTMNKDWSWSKMEAAMIEEFEDCHSIEFIEKRFDHDRRHVPSKEMKQWFAELGLMGCLSGTKFIPDIVERQNEQKVSLFLNKIFTCDGSAEASGRVSYSSKSKRMISQIQSMLLRFSIPSALHVKLVNGETYYEIAMSGKSVIDFKEKIGMSHAKGQRLSSICVEKSKREYVQGFSPEIWDFIWREVELKGLTKLSVYEAVVGKSASRGHKFKSGRVSLKLLSQINKVVKSNFLQNIIDGDWIMTTVRETVPVGKEMTYDISVRKNHNFIADNVIVHNSISLIHFGVAALLKNFKTRVAHFVLEGSTETTIMRYQSRISGIPEQRIASDELTPEEEEKLYKLGKAYTSRLDLIPFNQHWDYSTSDIEGRLAELDRRGRSPDLMIIDYADLLQPREKSREERINQRQVYRELKQLALMRKCAIWTAAQSQRPKEGPDKEGTLRSSSVAEAYEKVRIADFIGTLNQTPKEKKMGILRFHADIYRNNACDTTIRLLVDFERMIFHHSRYGTIENSDVPEWMKAKRKAKR